MENQEQYISALIELHCGLQRLGPGDVEFSSNILQSLPKLPPNPRIADIGCGTGAGALLLARHFQSKVIAVDFAKVFLDQMMETAAQEGIGELIVPLQADMGDLDWEPESIDFLWSESAAYSVTFEGALRAWKPFLRPGGLAVVSEMNYFSTHPSTALVEAMKRMYPTIQSEPENRELLASLGFHISEDVRLPSVFWWKNYYEPLRGAIARLQNGADEVMQSVIHEVLGEMKLFEDFHEEYGYTYYTLSV